MSVVSFLNDHGLDGLTNIKKAHITDKNVWILNYEQIPHVKDGLGKYHPVLCKCRNLVVREDSPNNWRIMSQSFRRFFNWTEDVKETELFTKALANGQVLASEKFDGSLITVTYFDDKWHVFTRGSDADTNPFRGMSTPTDSDTSKEDTFGSLVRKFIDPATLNKDITYIFELCTPLANVTHYSEQFLALLAANIQGVELDILAVHKTLPDHIRLPEMLNPTSIDELYTHLKTKSPDFEGYVLKYTDDDGIIHRMKLKTDTYVSLHHTKSKQFTNEDIINVIASGEIDEVLAYMPEYKERFSSIKVKLTNLSDEIDEFMDLHRGLSRKEFAMLIATKKNKWLYFDLHQNKYPNALSGFYHASNRTKAAAVL